MTRITFENVTHYYGKELALDNISISFEDNIPSALLGPSGCGKTTMLKIICGLITPTKGRIYFDDEDVTNVPPEKRNVAIVFQFPVVYPMSVEKNLLFPLININLSIDEKKRRIKEVANIIGIGHLLDVDARKLGPADRQRVALARALIRDPRIFLFDEPMSSIEPEKRVILKSELKGLISRLKKTCIFVTHDQTEAITFAEKIAIMTKGKIVQYGTYEEVYNRPLNTFVAFFIGYPGMNIIDCEIVNSKLVLGGRELELPQRYKKYIHRVIREVKLGVRPENIPISFTEMPGWIPVTVETYENLGNGLMIVEVRVNDTLLKIKSEMTPLIGKVKTLWIKIPDEHIYLFSPEGKLLEAEDEEGGR